MDEGLGFGLELWRGLLGVGGSYGVQECPATATEGFDVGRAVGRRLDEAGGGFGGFFFAHGEPGGDVCAGPATISYKSKPEAIE